MPLCGNVKGYYSLAWGKSKAFRESKIKICFILYFAKIWDLNFEVEWNEANYFDFDFGV